MTTEVLKEKMTGFKAVNVDKDGNYYCRDKYFKVGSLNTHNGDLKLCSEGFHFCQNGPDVYNYYSFSEAVEVFEIEIPEGAKIIQGEDKWVTDKFKLVRPVPDKGFNTGNRNTGDWNTGDSNTGYRNTGNRNTGYRNTGDWNTGDWNTCNHSTGFFNTVEQPVSLFNGAITMLRSEVEALPAFKALYHAPFSLTKWVQWDDLTTEQQAKTSKNSGGMTIALTFHQACADWWGRMPESSKALVQTLPGFDAAIFKEITGIEV